MAEVSTAGCMRKKVTVMSDKLVQVRGLKKHFISKSGLLRGNETVIKAVDGIDLDIVSGETLGIVGESGCGKSTTGRMIVKLIEPTEGSIKFAGNEISAYSAKQMRPLRKEMQIIFQDPYSSLNPRMSVESLIAEPMKLQGFGSAKDRQERVSELLSLVGLPLEYRDRHPHEFSGGQRQRIGIARAIALNPRFIVCDEAVSALDVSVQSQILRLLDDLQQRFALTYLFIAHGLNVVKYISDRVGVMYLGRIVELAPSDELYRTPLHPYTQSLLSAIPSTKPSAARERIVVSGEAGNPASPPSGCRFHPRCHACMEVCKVVEPTWKEVSPNQFVACHLY
jgi:oligopeptide/dipeptide ABC transporter ATP-binding protein